MISSVLLSSSTLSPSSSQLSSSVCHPTFTVILLMVVAIENVITKMTKEDPEKVFEFPEYDYTETPKHEITWKEWEMACTLTPACVGLLDMESKVKCVRRCISPSCYQEIYAFDELEEGEIDIRFLSFKGCFASRISRKRF